jgi:lipid II:glycine glycyltransferase (peptidoglycan interpeptide bridge formation enzyme)
MSHTVLVDLKKPVSQLWASLDKDSARWAVVRARKRSVQVDFTRSQEDLKQFYSLLKEARSRAGLPQYRWEDILNLWRIMEPAGMLRLVVARHEDKMIAGLMILCFNGVISAFISANSSYNIQRRLCANDLIHWSVIEHGASNGQRLYDLSGASLSTEQKAASIVRFKLKWGGAITEIPAVRRNVAHLDALRDLWQKVRSRYGKSIYDRTLG